MFRIIADYRSHSVGMVKVIFWHMYVCLFSGGAYLEHGVPTLDGEVPTLTIGVGYLPWLGVPILAVGTYLGQGVPTVDSRGLR